MSIEVSVIVPVFNTKPEYIRECLDSLLNQTYSKDKYEIIVVDDGSTNIDTKRVLQEYGNKVRLFVQPNKKTAGALNTGIKAMNGEWFMWLSSDDVWYQDKLEQQIMYAKAHPDVKVMYSDWERINELGYMIKNEVEPVFKTLKEQKARLSYKFFGCGSTIAIHKSCFEEVGIFNEKIFPCEDYEMWARLSTKWLFHKINMPLLKYRDHTDSLTIGTDTGEQVYKVTQIVRKILNYEDKLSVIVPAYNSEKTITECLQSILQEKEVDEVFVVDDGSIDKTNEIVTEIAKKENKIKLITFESNRGRAAARQVGIDKCKNHFIATVDSDITCYSGWTRFLFDEMLRLGVDVIAGSVKFSAIKEQFLKELMDTYMTLISKKSIGTACTIFKKSVFDIVKFDLNLKDGEDTDFFFRANKEGIPVIKVGNVVGVHNYDMDFFDYLRRQYQYGQNRAMLYSRHKDLMAGQVGKMDLNDSPDVMMKLLKDVTIIMGVFGFKDMNRRFR